MTTHVPWPEIDNFHTLRRTLQKYPELLEPCHTVAYRAKVKLHGTNAAVRVDLPAGTVTAMSRTSIITSNNDNCGFARWVESQKHLWHDPAAQFLPPEDDEPVRSIVYHGEWCGPGIQKGVAVNRIDRKVFAVFAVRCISGTKDDLIVDPAVIRYFIDRRLADVFIIPWHGNDEFTIDWSASASDLGSVIGRINDEVALVEACDPWVKENFGIEGVGEGLVMYPVDADHTTFFHFNHLAFKCKGEKHQVVAHTKPAQVDPTVASNLAAFANLVLTDARLEQGCRAVNDGELSFDRRNVGAFLAWINKDIAREARTELEASGLDQKAVTQTITSRARAWYLESEQGT